MATEVFKTYHEHFDYAEADPDPKYEVFNWVKWVEDHIALKQITIAALDPTIYATKVQATFDALILAECPPEAAKDLALLALYDLVVLLDDSTSMDYDDIPEGQTGGGGNGPRIATLKKVMKAVGEVYTHANVDGVNQVKFLNVAKGKLNVTGDKTGFLDTHKWGGVTRIGSELKRKILDPRVYSKTADVPMTKPLLVVVITDGTVEGEQKGLLEHTIISCVAACQGDTAKGRGAVAFQFAQVGTNVEAAKFLRRLGTDPKTKDYCDCLLESTLDAITDDTLKWEIVPQLLLGAIRDQWRNHYVPLRIKGEALTIDHERDLPEYGEFDTEEADDEA